MSKFDDLLFNLGYYWKAFAGFFGPAIVPLLAPLAQGNVPTREDWLMALGVGLAGAFFVGAAPANRRR